MNQFKLLAVTVLYSSLHAVYNKNNHKYIEIKTYSLS